MSGTTLEHALAALTEARASDQFKAAIELFGKLVAVVNQEPNHSVVSL